MSALPLSEADIRVGLQRVCFGANALNRCAIARCAGSPTASTVAGVKIVDGERVALS